MLSAAASAASYATATKHARTDDAHQLVLGVHVDELHAHAGPKPQWAPTSPSRTLHARPVSRGENRRASRPCAGEAGETAAGQREWAYANGNPLRYVDPDGRCWAVPGSGDFSCFSGDAYSAAWTSFKTDLGMEDPPGVESGSQEYARQRKAALATHAASETLNAARIRAEQHIVTVGGENSTLAGTAPPSVAPLLRPYPTNAWTDSPQMSVAEARHRNALGAGYLEMPLRKYSGFYEWYEAEQQRLDDVHLRGTLLVAGTAVASVLPMTAPMLVDVGGVSAGAAGMFSMAGGVGANASIEYGLTGTVTMEGTALSFAGEAWALRSGFGALAPLETSAATRMDAAAAATTSEFAGDVMTSGGGSAVFHRYNTPDFVPTGRHVTVEIFDSGGQSLGEFNQWGRKGLIEPVDPEVLKGVPRTSSPPFLLESPESAAAFGSEGFESGRWRQYSNDCVTGACAVANQGKPVGGPISPATIRRVLKME